MNETEEHFTGALLDPRPQNEIKFDWKHEDIASATAVEWVEKDTYRYFDKRNQAYSSSCMMQSGVKMLGVENFVEEGVFLTLSAHPGYRDRANYPSGGMFHQDCLSLLCKPKNPLESQIPSQGMSEAQLNADYPVFTPEIKATAEKYKGGGYFTFKNCVDMDAIATIVDQKKAVQIMVFFRGEEYWKEVPEIIYENLKNDQDASRHGITIVDRTLYKGKRAWVIEDSAGNSSSIDKKGQRILTEDFFTKRCFSAGYLLPLANVQINRTLRIGMTGTDVGIVQKVLKDKGFFPVTQSITNYFGPITKASVQHFQIVNHLKPDGVIGELTRSALFI